MLKIISNLVIGRTYKFRSKSWFEKQVLKKSDSYWHNKAIAYAGKQLVLGGIVNNDTLVFKTENRFADLWAVPGYVTEVAGQKEPDEAVLAAIERLRQEKFISVYTGGPGGGDSDTMNTQQAIILPAILESGTFSVYMQPNGLGRKFTVTELNKLFETGEVEQGFQATEYSYMTTRLTLIKDKKKLPSKSSWEDR